IDRGEARAADAATPSSRNVAKLDQTKRRVDLQRCHETLRGGLSHRWPQIRQSKRGQRRALVCSRYQKRRASSMLRRGQKLFLRRVSAEWRSALGWGAAAAETCHRRDQLRG